MNQGAASNLVSPFELSIKMEAEGTEEDAEVADEKVEDVEVPEPDEETRSAMAKRRPRAPTKKDVDEHLPLHLESRDWCEDCVAGRGHAAAHRNKNRG